MKILYTIISIACLHFTSFAQQTLDDSSTVEFQRLAEKWRAAYNSKEAKNLAPMYAEDAEYISGHVSGLVAHGRDAVIANFQRGMNMQGYIDAVEVLSVNLSCDLAAILCRYEATNAGQKAVGRNLLVVKKINGTWLIITHMTVV